MRRWTSFSLVAVVALGIPARAEVTTVPPELTEACAALGGGHRVELGHTEEKDAKVARCLNKAGKPDGPSRTWYLDGQLKAEGGFRAGEFHGLWQRYHPNGEKKDRGEWSDGRPVGKWQFWHDNGKLKAEGAYEAGEEKGIWRYYLADGTLREEKDYSAPAAPVASAPAPVASSTPEQEPAPTPTPTSAQAPERGYNLLGSVGWTTVQYSQTAIPAFTIQALTLKAAARTNLFTPSLDLAANVFFTVLPFRSTIPTITARFLGANVRLGYAIPFIPEPFRLSIAAGFYYATMFVTGNAFGYSDLLYPQFYPSLRYKVPNGDSLVFYVKYVPLAAGEREFSVGVSWDPILKWIQRPVYVAADVSDLVVSVSADNVVSAKTFTLSVGVGI